MIPSNIATLPVIKRVAVLEFGVANRSFPSLHPGKTWGLDVKALASSSGLGLEYTVVFGRLEQLPPSIALQRRG